MGLKMNTGAVKSQLSDMNRNLDTMVTRANLLQSRISMFTETQALLVAATYDSIREYYASVHLPLLRGLICYAEELKEANENYSRQIDSWLDADYVDEDGLQEDLETIIRCRNRLNNIEEWGPATYALDHTLEQMQWKIEEKLERIEAFLSATTGIYAEGDNQVLKRGITCMQGVKYNALTGKINISVLDFSWTKKIEEQWEQRENLNTIATKGILKEIEESLPDLSDEDINKILKLAEKSPNIELPNGLKVYFLNMLSDIVPDIVEATGGGIMNLGDLLLTTATAGPSGANSFLLLNSSTALKGAKMKASGGTVSSIGKVGGWILAGIGFGIGIRDDLDTGSTVGEAISHNLVSTGIGVGAGTLTTGIISVVASSTPVGWAIVGSALVGTAAVQGFEWAYDNNFLGLKDGLDWVGKQIDLGVDAAKEFIDDGVDWAKARIDDIGEGFSALGEFINPFNWAW